MTSLDFKNSDVPPSRFETAIGNFSPWSDDQSRNASPTCCRLLTQRVLPHETLLRLNITRGKRKTASRSVSSTMIKSRTVNPLFRYFDQINFINSKFPNF